MDNVAAHYRRQGQVAAHQVRIITRQQNDLAGPKHEALSFLTLDADTKLTLSDVVIQNQVGRCPRAGAQCSGVTRAAMHHGAKKSACKHTPPVKCATLRTRITRPYIPSYQHPVFWSYLPAARS
jgi:hypothetical protein